MNNEKTIKSILELTQTTSHVKEFERGLSGIPYGHHNEYFTSLAGHARRVGLDSLAIFELLKGVPTSILEGYDDNNPFTDEYFKKLAESMGSKETPPKFEIKNSSWRNANSLPENQPNIEWILYRFVPQHKLTFQYGKGGIGKSSWIPWLVSKLLKEGLKVGFSATEETFERFSNAVRLSTKNFSKDIFDNLYDLDNDWIFPKDENKLREGLDKCPLDFIYFDSIYDIFDPKGAGIFTNTRQCLKPLSLIAQDYKVTILGTFHENKSGTFNGSKEMESVPRALIHATEHEQRLRLHVEKSNNKKPDHDLLSIGEWVKETNPNGSVVQEKNKHGIWEDSEIFIVSDFEEIQPDVESKNEIRVDDLIQDSSNDEAFWKVLECKKENPSWGRDKISECTGLSSEVVKLRLKNIGKDDI